MNDERIDRPPAPRPRRHRVVVMVMMLLAATGLGAIWWASGIWSAPAGGPRLVLDRTEVDLGVLPFNAPVQAVFILTNAGAAPLRILEVPQVKAVKGC